MSPIKSLNLSSLRGIIIPVNIIWRPKSIGQIWMYGDTQTHGERYTLCSCRSDPHTPCRLCPELPSSPWAGVWTCRLCPELPSSPWALNMQTVSCITQQPLGSEHADCVLNYPAAPGLWTCRLCPELPSSPWALNMQTVSWITQQPLGSEHADCVLNYPAASGLWTCRLCPELPSSPWALNMQTVSWITQQPLGSEHADCVLNYPAAPGLWTCRLCPVLPSSPWALDMQTVSWITQQPLGSGHADCVLNYPAAPGLWTCRLCPELPSSPGLWTCRLCPELPSSPWALDMQTVSWITQQPLGSEHASIKPESVCVTYGFMLNRSRITMAAYGSRLRLRSEQNLSLVQVMWTRSGDTSGLSFRAAWDAVFLSWISWACAVITSHIKHYSIMQMTCSVYLYQILYQCKLKQSMSD